MSNIEETIDEAYQYYLDDRLRLTFKSGEGTQLFNTLTPKMYHMAYEEYNQILPKEDFCRLQIEIKKMGYEILGDKNYARGGMFIVVNKHKPQYEYNLIDFNGNLLLSQWSQENPIIEKDYILIDGIKYKRILKKFVRSEVEDDICPPKSPIKRVLESNHHMRFDDIAYEGHRRVYDKKGHADYIDLEGNSLLGTFIIKRNKLLWKSKCKFDYIEPFRDGYAIVKKDGKYNAIDHQGNLVFDEWYTELQRIGPGVFKKGKGITSKTLYPNFKGKKVRRSISGYKITDDEESKTVGNTPIMPFGTRYILCQCVYYYLYDLQSEETIEDLLSYSDIAFDNNFLYFGKSQKLYYFHGDNMIEISDFFRDELFYKTHITKSSVEVPIMSRREFGEEYKKDPFIFLDKLKREHNRIKDEQRKKKENEFLFKARELYEKREAERKAEIANCIEQIKELIKRVHYLTNNVEEISIEDDTELPLREVTENGETYLEIPHELNGILSIFDFRKIDLTGVKVSGIDFRGCNVENINPQLVWHKDLSGCDFTGVGILPATNFDGVNIKGAKFSRDNDDKTLEFSPYSLMNAIYDDETTFDGIQLKIILEGLKMAEEEPVER